VWCCGRIFQVAVPGSFRSPPAPLAAERTGWNVHADVCGGGGVWAGEAVPRRPSDLAGARPASMPCSPSPAPAHTSLYVTKADFSLPTTHPLGPRCPPLGHLPSRPPRRLPTRTTARPCTTRNSNSSNPPMRFPRKTQTIDPARRRRVPLSAFQASTSVVSGTQPACSVPKL